MVSQVLRELANSENHAQTHKGCTDFRTPVLDVVVDVLRRWIEGGAEGVKNRDEEEAREM
jgi:hypothetical protein